MKEMLEGDFRGGDVKGIRPEVLRRLIQEFLQIIGLPDDDIVNIFTNVIYKIYPHTLKIVVKTLLIKS